jgi:hypothetical protein
MPVEVNLQQLLHSQTSITLPNVEGHINVQPKVAVSIPELGILYFAAVPFVVTW